MKGVIEQIRNSLLPSKVVGRKVNLKHKGSGEYTGLCPFHNEKTPSFTVSDIKGFYHCFGCGAHGDIFTFLINSEGHKYSDALKLLADEAGIKLPQFTKQQLVEEHKYQVFESIFEFVTSYYVSNLQKFIGLEALRYLKKRGLQPQTIAKFRLGFAPEHDNELISLLTKHHKMEMVRESGVLGKPDATYSSNMFRGRVIFPIFNVRGNVIAFGGRSLDGTEPKYLNSAENPLFNKGCELYGLNFARQVMAKTNQIILVEGYMDVIALANVGIENVVAPLGTAVKEGQIERLWQYSPEPIVIMDDDNAGRKASERVAAHAFSNLKPGKTLKFLTLIGGKDPDEVVLNKGKDFFLTLLPTAEPLGEFIFRAEVSKMQSKVPEHIAALKNLLIAKADSLADNSLKQSYRSFFMEKFFQTFANKKAIKKKEIINLDKNAVNGVLLLEEQIMTEILEYSLQNPTLLCNYSNIEKLVHLEIKNLNLDQVRNEIIHITEEPGWEHSNDALEKLRKLYENREYFVGSVNFKFSSLQESIEEQKEHLERLFNLLELNLLQDQAKVVYLKISLDPTAELFDKLKAIKEQEEYYKNKLGVV